MDIESQLVTITVRGKEVQSAGECIKCGGIVKYVGLAFVWSDVLKKTGFKKHKGECIECGIPFYIELSITPEHDKRNEDSRGINTEIQAAYAYVDSVIHTVDNAFNKMWHGWALREAFLAGISYSETQNKKPERKIIAWINKDGDMLSNKEYEEHLNDPKWREFIEEEWADATPLYR